MATVPGPGADAPCSLWQDWPAHNGAAQMVMANKCTAAQATAPCLTCPAGAADSDCKWVWLGKAKTFEDCRELATALQTLEHDGPTRHAICQTATWCRPDAAKPGDWDEACYCGTGTTWIAPSHAQGNTDAAICLRFGGAWGAPFLLAAALLAMAYLGGGVLLQARASGAPLKLGSHPHAAAWQELRLLCTDGLAFARQGGVGRGRPPAAAGGSVRSPLRAEASRSASARDERGKERKGGGKKTQRSQEKAEKQRSAEGREASAVTDEGGGGGGEGVVEGGKSTTAGSGGRWVHVAS